MTASTAWSRWTDALLLAALVAVLTSPAAAAPSAMSRADIMCRVSSSVGYSYHWGGSCWCANGCSPGNCAKGSCSGNCPSCSHSGTYGADCSGLVNKVWQVPDNSATTTCGHGPYVANSYTSSTSNWSVISRSSIKQGDAMASSTHVLIYDYGDPWGQLVAYEARGCSYGIVHNTRSCSASYNAARRANLISDCQCSPGETQSEACGNCGTRTRSCGGNCTWGAWSGCSGQGPCSPGEQQTEPCCDCGSKTRSCTQQCEWADWSGCAGPDPGGACATGEPGPCADGTVRCIEGCSACVSDYEPTAELCDAFDNDCSGVADDGSPSIMGEPPPAFAARLLDASFPAQLDEGDEGEAWASFRNEGTATWKAGAVWLSSSSADEMKTSPLYHQDTWPAWDVAAVLKEDVEPGSVAMFSWKVQAPDEAGELLERFRLEDPDGALMQCPAPEVELRVRVGQPWQSVTGGVAELDDGGLEGTLSCSLGRRGGSSGWAWMLAGVLLAGLLRSRAAARRPVAGRTGRGGRWWALAWLVLAACTSNEAGTPAAPVEPAAEAQPLLFIDRLAERLPAALPVDGRRATAADLDGDGATDVVQPTAAGLLIHWGDATSEQVRDGEELVQALAGDLDGDGLVDLVLLQAAEPALVVLRQISPRTFDEVELDTPGGVSALAGELFDADGDGDLDLAVATVTAPSPPDPAEEPGEPAGGLMLLVNDGGVLVDDSSARLMAAELEPRDLAAGDLDGDGAIDLLLSGDGADHRLLVGDGEGTFRDAAPDTLPSVSDPRGRLPILGDLNGDGRLDVVLCSAERTLVWLGDASAGLVDATDDMLGAAAVPADHGAIADLDRDGHADLVLARQSGPLHLYRNDGHGRLFDYSERLVPFGPATSDAVSVTAADLDGDADLDLFVSRAGVAAPWLLINWYPSFDGDQDGDGVPDEVDNCPAEPNADQSNQDASPFSCASGSDCLAQTGCRLAVFGGEAAYLVCRDQAASWEQARAFCQARGADLAVVGSKAEHDFLASLELPASWIGLTDADEEGTFSWVDGSEIDDDAWAEGEPNDSGGIEDCVTLATDAEGAASWNDLDCAASRPFLCEERPRRTATDPGDACDLCVAIPDVDQMDSDDDGVGDACDVQ